MFDDRSFHYPADLLNHLIDTIPLITKSKKDVFVFFQGAGIQPFLMTEIKSKWVNDPASVSKFDIVRNILIKLNEGGDKYLRERREVLKRVVEFDSFSACYPDNILKAKALVAEIKQLTGLKDSVTKIIQEQERNRQLEIQKRKKDQAKRIEKKAKIDEVKRNLFAQFSEPNHHVRGKALEKILNDLFKAYGISIRESFSIKGSNQEGIVEQLDGVIALDSHLYLVEMKWWHTPIGVSEIMPHIGRLLLRADAKGIFISASEYTEPAVTCCREFLQQKTIVLVSLEELISLLEAEYDLIKFLKQKIDIAVVEKNPWRKILCS